MVTSRCKEQEQGAKLLAMSKIPAVEDWLREVNAAIREYLILYIARGDGMSNDISDEKFSSVQEVMIEHLTRLPLGLLAKNDVRVRLWLAEQLTPEILQDDLTMTVGQAAEIMAVDPETIRRNIRNRYVPLRALLPAGQTRLWEVEVSRLAVMRQMRPPIPGGSRGWVPPAEEDANEELIRLSGAVSASTGETEAGPLAETIARISSPGDPWKDD